jgi:hypothetical protein
MEGDSIKIQYMCPFFLKTRCLPSLSPIRTALELSRRKTERKWVCTSTAPLKRPEIFRQEIVLKRRRTSRITHCRYGQPSRRTVETNSLQTSNVLGRTGQRKNLAIALTKSVVSDPTIHHSTMRLTNLVETGRRVIGLSPPIKEVT